MYKNYLPTPCPQTHQCWRFHFCIQTRKSKYQQLVIAVCIDDLEESPKERRSSSATKHEKVPEFNQLIIMHVLLYAQNYYWIFR